MYYGTREYKFEMSHALFRKNVDDPEDRSTYYLDVNPHGHNWTLKIEIAGSLDPDSEMILDLTDLDKLVKEKIINQYDHKDFDIFSFGKVPTLENLTVAMWQRLRPSLPLLVGIRLEEEPTIYSHYFGAANMLYVTYSYDFNARHRTYNPKLPEGRNAELYGKCQRFHGHTYTLDVTFKGTIAEDTKQLISHYELEKCMDKFISEFHMQTLNDYPNLENATTENFIRVVWNELQKDLGITKLTNDRVQLHKIRIRETAKNYFDYCGNNNHNLF